MKVITPDFYKEFHCIAGACTDSCCKQGWQIAVDEEHLDLYRSLEGELGQRVRNALEVDAEGDTILKMDGGICRLLDGDGLCALARVHGEESLCHLCHTHPRFIEGYSGTTELHLSLQCPEAARLTLEREAPITYEEKMTDAPVTLCNIDPDEYIALMEFRKYCLNLMQERRIAIGDRFALLLQFARWAQNLLDEKKYELCKPMCHLFRQRVFCNRQINALKRLRLKGTGFFPEIDLYRSLEHLTEEFPAALHEAIFTARSSEAFDNARAVQLEHLAVTYLAHYIPKAVNDGRVDTKIRLAVLLALTVRRLCVCIKKEAVSDMAHFAGLLAKEIEHSEENMAAVYAALENTGWHEHLAAQLDLRKGE